MSRRDIAVILERLTLDHRTSLAEKACAYLQAVESNGAIRNNSSHAAICVDIAADQLSIEASRQALILLSGAPSHVTYANALQTLTEFLTGSGNKEEQNTGAGSKSFVARGTNDNTRHAHMRRLLSSSTASTLRQLAVQYGSMEMDDLVLECLEQFFDVWVRSLVPAQRVHVVYSHEKWMGAAFWLCAMARNMVAPKEEEHANKEKPKGSTTTAAGAAGSTVKTKKIGGRQGKELKDMIMAAVGHKVQKKELETTIKLIEEKVPDYFVSLMKPSGSASAVKPTAPRKRKVSSNSDTSSGGGLEVITSGGADTLATQYNGNGSAPGGDSENKEQPGLSSSRRVRQQTTDPYQRLGTKRTISNVSQISRSSDVEDDDGESPRQATRPASKRTKMDAQGGPELSSAGIMSTKKGASRKNLKEVTAASQTASQMLSQRRKTGGIYSMIPRIKYEDTRAYAQYQEWKSRILKAAENAT